MFHCEYAAMLQRQITFCEFFYILTPCIESEVKGLRFKHTLDIKMDDMMASHEGSVWMTPCWLAAI